MLPRQSRFDVDSGIEPSACRGGRIVDAIDRCAGIGRRIKLRTRHVM